MKLTKSSETSNYSYNTLPCCPQAYTLFSVLLFYIHLAILRWSYSGSLSSVLGSLYLCVGGDQIH